MNEYQQQSAPMAHLPKPGMVQTIAIMCLISGILNIIWGFVVMILLAATLVCWPIGIYPIVLGILEIIYASKLLPEPARADKPAQYLAIMQIVNIVCGNILSLITGILSLVFYNDPQVKAYFETLAPKYPTAVP